jgi:hypothetical protein
MESFLPMFTGLALFFFISWLIGVLREIREKSEIIEKSSKY